MSIHFKPTYKKCKEKTEENFGECCLPIWFCFCCGTIPIIIAVQTIIILLPAMIIGLIIGFFRLFIAITYDFVFIYWSFLVTRGLTCKTKFYLFIPLIFVILLRGLFFLFESILVNACYALRNIFLIFFSNFLIFSRTNISYGRKLESYVRGYLLHL